MNLSKKILLLMTLLSTAAWSSDGKKEETIEIEGPKVNFTETFPKDALSEIVLYCDVETIDSLFHTNQKLRKFIKSELFWKLYVNQGRIDHTIQWIEKDTTKNNAKLLNKGIDFLNAITLCPVLPLRELGKITLGRLMLDPEIPEGQELITRFPWTSQKSEVKLIDFEKATWEQFEDFLYLTDGDEQVKIKYIELLDLISKNLDKPLAQIVQANIFYDSTMSKEEIYTKEESLLIKEKLRGKVDPLKILDLMLEKANSLSNLELKELLDLNDDLCEDNLITKETYKRNEEIFREALKKGILSGKKSTIGQIQECFQTYSNVINKDLLLPQNANNEEKRKQLSILEKNFLDFHNEGPYKLLAQLYYGQTQNEQYKGYYYHYLYALMEKQKNRLSPLESFREIVDSAQDSFCTGILAYPF